MIRSLPIRPLGGMATLVLVSMLVAFGCRSDAAVEPSIGETAAAAQVCSTQSDCNDNNPCTDDACVSASTTPNAAPKQCIHEARTGATCDDDANVCTGMGQCAADGQCILSGPAPEGASCDDGEPCNGIATCDGEGHCQPAAAPAAAGTRCAGDAPPCVTAECNGEGTCVPVPHPGASCDDGNGCTTASQCSSIGICVAVDFAQSGAPCGDGNACNGQETCDGAGTCASGTPLPGPDVALAACDPKTGEWHASSCGGFDDLGRTTTIADAAVCLYKPVLPGVPALQRPLDGYPDLTFDPLRVAIVRGVAKAPSGAPIPDVHVSVLEHPEFGYTLTRESGAFDMAVLGGGRLTVAYEMPGFLPAQRWVEAAEDEYAHAEDVTLRPRSAVSAPIDLQNGGAAKGEATSDERGARQPVVIFQPGTKAMATMPGGSQVEIQGNAHLRVTEYTRGPEGRSAMPGSLAPNVAYTYCASYELDEAVGAERVEFNTPVSIYLDDFIGFGLPMSVPIGYYDEKTGTWVPSDNAQVVRIVEVDHGKAVLSAGHAEDGSAIRIDGLDDPATPEADFELREVAKLYPVGKTLWRARIDHFTPIDGNMSAAPPDGAEPPEKEKIASQGLDDPCKKLGSIIECENRTLREEIPVTGTPFSLVYSSANVPGKLPALRVPIRKNTHPKAIATLLQVRVAGFSMQKILSPGYDGDYELAWTGHDSMGRLLQGSQPATVDIGYMYSGVWGSPRSFGGSDTSQTCGGGPCNGIIVEPPPPVILWRSHQAQIGHWNGRLDRIGGLGFDVHHVYDVQGRVFISAAVSGAA
jgi:hypothetical protein